MESYEGDMIYSNVDNSIEDLDASNLYSSIEKSDHNEIVPHTTRSRKNTVLEWANISFGISQSLSHNDLCSTIPSLLDVPSDDRRSSGFLMGVNLQSMILGTSLLSLPYCFKVAGIWSLVLIFFIGVLSTFTANILSDCQYQMSKSRPDRNKRVYVSFVDMSRSCWNSTGAFVMEILVYISLARNIVVIILLSDITHEILTEVGVSKYDKKLLSVAWTLLTLPLLFITRVSILAWVSFFGLILYLIAMTAVMVLCIMNFENWNFTNISMDFDIQGVGIACGIIINSYAVHMNLPALEASLHKPEVYKKINNLTFISNVIAKIAFALFGYLTFAEKTQQEITSNIYTHPPLPTILRFAVAFFAYFTTPLQSFVVFTLVDETFQPKFPACRNSFIWLLISRSLFMTVCLLIAVLIPQFGLVVSLIGSIRGSAITLILPALYYISLATNKKQRSKLILAYFTAMFGIIASVVGAYSSISAMVSA